METTNLVRALAAQIRGPYEWYVAITRGGLVPACLLAQVTGQTNIDTICVTSYAATRERGALRAVYKDLTHLRGARVLVVDDLVDSGETLKFVVAHLFTAGAAEVESAVLLRKAATSFEPTYFAEAAPADQWIEFPWEPKTKEADHGE
jgi:hypoxanthine phosphoribosyltransferase